MTLVLFKRTMIKYMFWFYLEQVTVKENVTICVKNNALKQREISNKYLDRKPQKEN